MALDQRVKRLQDRRADADLIGQQLQAAYPMVPLAENQALGIAIMSYNGQLNFGLLGDFDALPDIDQIAENLAAELATLLSLAREATAAAV